jgi:adenosylcobyric acid synthase
VTAKPVFVGGTASHVGKSWVATALWRYLYRMGLSVAPFKAQNMSNNSMACPGGGEIGRSQAAQAETCGLKPHPDMSPMPLNPTGTLDSQVVLNGRPWRNLKAPEYGNHFDYLLEQFLKSYSRLAARYDYVVIEGAGSVAELNLAHHGLVNFGLARRLDAPSILVADIDRGGIFASMIGTPDLLDHREASLVRSFLVNRFRGDRPYFEDGIRILEEKSDRPCLGVFPFLEDVCLDQEDSVSLEDMPKTASNDSGAPNGSGSRVTVVRLPHISNFTDLRRMPDAVFLSDPVAEAFDVVFLPGTKSPIEDMSWLRARGLDRWLSDQMSHGSQIVGVCGGFQMMGEAIHDPEGVESGTESTRGLGFFPVTTRLAQEKTTRTVTARTSSGLSFHAYEIHMGVTSMEGVGSGPFAILEDGTGDGLRRGQAISTYLHGAFENQGVIEELLGHPVPDVHGDKQFQYYLLTNWFVGHVEDDVFLREYFGSGMETMKKSS